MKRIIRLVIFALALIFALGSVGAYEVGNIGLGQCLLQGGLATLVAWLALRKCN